jgi:ribosome-associated protein
MIPKDSIATLNLIAQTIYQKKGFNILALDVRGVSTMTDFFIIGEGTVDRHVVALAKSVIEVLETSENMSPAHVEGLDSGDWVVVDYHVFVVHLFKPGLRDKYRLDEVWHEGKVVDLDLAQKTSLTAPLQEM